MFNTFGVTAYQWTAGALSNGGEKIQLNDNAGNVVDSLTYDDYLPWDTLCDGYGPSLTLCNPNLDNSIAENWSASTTVAAINASGDTIYATPGAGCGIDILAGFEGNPTIVAMGGSVMFTDLSLGDITEWTWTFEGGDPASYSGQTPPEIFYNEEGVFDVTLLVSDGTNSDELTMFDYIEVVNLPAPTGLEAEVGSYDDVTLSWLAPGPTDFSDDPLGYNVYRDGDIINTALVEETQYYDEEPSIGTHDYYVTAVYTEGESAPSNTVTVVITNINEVEVGSVNIYPNPADDMFNINVSDGLDVNVSVIDLTGKTVYYNNIKESTKINVSGYNSGVYFVRILDNVSGTVSAHKLIIK